MRNPMYLSAAFFALGAGISIGGSAYAQGIGANVTPGSAVSVFGSRGQLAISSEAGVDFEHTSVSGVDGSTTTFRLRPGVDYFLMDRFSLGVFVGFDRQSLPSGSSTTFGIGPRAGYDIPFSDRFSLWPKAGLSYNRTSLDTDASSVGGVTVPASEATNNAIALNLFAPLLYHTHRFFAGVGPALDTDLSGDLKATTFAVRVTLGGWVF